MRFEILCGLTTKCPPAGANRRWVWEWVLDNIVPWTLKPFSPRGPNYNTSETPTIAFGRSWPAKRHYLLQAYNRILSL